MPVALSGNQPLAHIGKTIRRPAQTQAERQAEHQRLADTETAESLATGIAQWQVRVEFGSHRETVALARKLENEGRAVVRRWKFLIAGASNEDDARGTGRTDQAGCAARRHGHRRAARRGLAVHALLTAGPSACAHTAATLMEPWLPLGLAPRPATSKQSPITARTDAPGHRKHCMVCLTMPGRSAAVTSNKID